MITYFKNLLKEEAQKTDLFVFFANKQEIQFEKPIKIIEKEIKQKLKANSRDVTSLLIQAQILYKYQLQEAKALEVLKKVLQIDPLNIDARLELVQILLKKKNLPQKNIEVLIDECLQLDENYWRNHYTQALKYLQSDQLLKSKLCLAQCHERFPNVSHIRILYAQVLSEYKSCCQLSQQIIQEEATKSKLDYESILRIAYAFGNFDNQEMCEKYLLMAIQINSNSSKANNNLGYFYRYIKKNDDLCIKYCKKALEIDPNNQDSYYNLSASYSSKEDYKNSTISLKKCLDINKNYYQAYQDLIYITYNNLKQIDVAFYLIQKLIKMFPNNQYGLYFLSYIQLYDLENQSQLIKRDLELTEIAKLNLIKNVLQMGSKFNFITIKNVNSLLNLQYNNY
ncbi:hypothetical protein ABPG74_016184 [Tetrahymena malaccensis]